MIEETLAQVLETRRTEVGERAGRAAPDLRLEVGQAVETVGGFALGGRRFRRRARRAAPYGVARPDLVEQVAPALEKRRRDACRALVRCSRSARRLSRRPRARACSLRSSASTSNPFEALEPVPRHQHLDEQAVDVLVCGQVGDLEVRMRGVGAQALDRRERGFARAWATARFPRSRSAAARPRRARLSASRSPTRRARSRPVPKVASAGTGSSR